MLSSIVSPLDGFRSPFGPQRGFNPSSLFRNGEQGWFYDLSDMPTLFQEAAGTTPVTAVGQPVGLQLDKSKGLVLGPELVTNGDFSNGTTGWVAGPGGTIAVSGGQLTGVSGGASNIVASQAIAAVIGRTYEIRWEVVSVNAGTGSFVGFGGAVTTIAAGSGARVARITATTTGQLNFFGSGANSSATIDNISVRELPGNHRSQSVSLNRPTLRQDTNGLYYLEYDGLNDSLSTSAFAWGTDKATVVAGVRKLSNSVGTIAEFSAALASNAGSFNLSNRDFAASTGAKWFWASRGSALLSTAAEVAASDATTAILSGIGDIASDTMVLRVNGAQAASNASDQGTGNFGTHAAFFGARAGTSLFFNGREYSSFAINRLLTANELTQIERYTAQRTGVTL